MPELVTMGEAMLILGYDLPEMGRRACIAGAMATRVFGDWEGMPFRDDLDALTRGASQLSR